MREQGVPIRQNLIKLCDKCIAFSNIFLYNLYKTTLYLNITVNIIIKYSRVSIIRGPLNWVSEKQIWPVIHILSRN